MATAYTTGASKMSAGIQPKTLERGSIDVFSSFNLANSSPVSSNGFSVNDTIYFVTLEGDASNTNSGYGPTITDVVLDVPALDSSTGIVLAVGDDSSGSYAANYISGATIGRSSTAGQQLINVHGGYGFQPFASAYGTYTTPSLQTCHIIMKVTTAATGTAATSGTIGLLVTYSMDA